MSLRFNHNSRKQVKRDFKPGPTTRQYKFKAGQKKWYKGSYWLNICCFIANYNNESNYKSVFKTKIYIDKYKQHNIICSTSTIMVYILFNTVITNSSNVRGSIIMRFIPHKVIHTIIFSLIASFIFFIVFYIKIVMKKIQKITDSK